MIVRVPLLYGVRTNDAEGENHKMVTAHVQHLEHSHLLPVVAYLPSMGLEPSDTRELRGTRQPHGPEQSCTCSTLHGV